MSITSSSTTDLSAPITVLPSSRLKDTKVLVQSQSRTREWGLWVADPTFAETIAFTMYQVRDTDIGRLDLLSYDFYGTVEYGWIIADANNLRNWMTDMRVGDMIRIPNQSVIEAYVRRKGRV
jgi:hypothetical protein